VGRRQRLQEVGVVMKAVDAVVVSAVVQGSGRLKAV
jgi:hypothetical protein